MPDFLLILIVTALIIIAVIYLVLLISNACKKNIILFLTSIVGLSMSIIWGCLPYHYDLVDDVGIIIRSSTDKNLQEYKSQYVVFQDRGKEMQVIDLTKDRGQWYDDTTMFVKVYQRKVLDNGILWILCTDEKYRLELYRKKQ